MFGGLWDSFIRFKAAQGVSERTLSDYEVRVKKLFLFGIIDRGSPSTPLPCPVGR